MNADGSNLMNITNTPTTERDPAWSPDGTMIVYISHREVGFNVEIYVMNADGTDQRRLGNFSGPAARPAWCCFSSPCTEEPILEYIPVASPEVSPAAGEPLQSRYPFILSCFLAFAVAVFLVILLKYRKAH